jgi:hypothetical protein
MDATGRRRWCGGLALFGALAMLILGESVLKGRLKDLGFVSYWLLCFGFVGTAIVMAALDLQAIRKRTRDEQKMLMETTLSKIDREARKKRDS